MPHHPSSSCFSYLLSRMSMPEWPCTCISRISRRHCLAPEEVIGSVAGVRYVGGRPQFQLQNGYKIVAYRFTRQLIKFSTTTIQRFLGVPSKSELPAMSTSAQSNVSQPLSHPHLQFLDNEAGKQNAVGAYPIFTHHVEEKLPKSERPAQYGLLGCNISRPAESPSHSIRGVEQLKTRLFYNVSAPTSTFICGSQGSGKSHTLSTLLENCLIPSKANKLIHPLAGLVFHYDTFISDTGGMPCEAAYLSSHPAVKVQVLCAPSNIRHIQVSPCLLD